MDPNGNSNEKGVHRKIELQSPADWFHLRDKVAQVAREKIAQRVPQDGSEKEAVEKLVDEYITKTFTLASSSVLINGLEPPSSPTSSEEVEPFDTALAKKIQTLYAQIEAETLAVAKLRREKPALVAERYKQNLTRSMGSLDDGQEDEVPGVEFEVGRTEKLDDVKETFEGAVGETGDLPQLVDETEGRVRKAKGVVDSVFAGKGE
ncbi:hypothetical protein K470DRAFT_250384 [Piedraia hortae CBS 480.64]|uniref:Kinetochore protein mis14 n=1 Tax=Piedraia hortae CBS 480.64 TaxID=1314780 RepID=A0A6A7BU74_9PEZI|nr:hypothetical protein K470DRAFT_250384 [Piedraia hortae CBS 480.64]